MPPLTLLSWKPVALFFFLFPLFNGWYLAIIFKKNMVSRKHMLECSVGFLMAYWHITDVQKVSSRLNRQSSNGKKKKKAEAKETSTRLCVCVRGIFSFVGLLIFKEIHLGKEILLPPPHDIASFPMSILTCFFYDKWWPAHQTGSSGRVRDLITCNPPLHNNLIKIPK